MLVLFAASTYEKRLTSEVFCEKGVLGLQLD